MKIRVEIKEKQDYYNLRSELIEEGRKFDAATLQLLPYHQLYLCCIGNAGDTACAPDLVAAEKQARRQRFLSMENDDFAKCEAMLRYEEMYDDVLLAINQQAAPHWDQLSLRQQAWAKLHCAWTHLNDVTPRLREAHALLHWSRLRSIPEDVVEHYCGKLDTLIEHASNLPDEMVRNQIEELRDGVRDFLPEPELSICLKEQIRGFVCTSDCFRVPV